MNGFITKLFVHNFPLCYVRLTYLCYLYCSVSRAACWVCSAVSMLYIRKHSMNIDAAFSCAVCSLCLEWYCSANCVGCSQSRRHSSMQQNSSEFFCTMPMNAWRNMVALKALHGSSSQGIWQFIMTPHRKLCACNSSILISLMPCGQNFWYIHSWVIALCFLSECCCCCAPSLSLSCHFLFPALVGATITAVAVAAAAAVAAVGSVRRVVSRVAAPAGAVAVHAMVSAVVVLAAAAAALVQVVAPSLSRFYRDNTGHTMFVRLRPLIGTCGGMVVHIHDMSWEGEDGRLCRLYTHLFGLALLPQVVVAAAAAAVAFQ